MMSPNVAGSSCNVLEFNPVEGLTPLLINVGGRKNPPLPLSFPAKTFANVFIAIVAAGILGLPYAFVRMMHGKVVPHRIGIKPVYEIFKRRFCGGQYCLRLRWLLAVLVSLVVLLVPNLADFLSLVGSSFSCALGFILPALFHLLVFKDEMGWSGWILDSGVIVLGIIFGISGTWYALMEIFKIPV